MPRTLEEIRRAVSGELVGDGSAAIHGVNALESAQLGELSFAEHERLLPLLSTTRASAILVPRRFAAVPGKTLLRVDNPRAALVVVMHLFQVPSSALRGRHPSAVIAPQAVLAADVSVGECAVIRAGASVGRGTVIDSGAHIGADVALGEQCVIGPNVVIMNARLGHRVVIHAGSVIGADGFGYVWQDGRHVKIPQIGSVVIEDDVEIGANACIDRAMFGSTIIRRGTKIDNLVQIAHNDVIGEDVIITGQVGFSGSVTVGNRAVFGGQSGVTDHVTIGDDARIGAGTPVIRDVHAGETVWGFPAKSGPAAKREIASLAYLPRLLHQFKTLLGRLGRLESRLSSIERGRRKRSSSTP